MLTFLKRAMLVLAFLCSATSIHAQGSDSSAVRCLAENISFEAPDESYTGKLAVATVTMNRVHAKAFPKTVCGVVYQRNTRGCQFSWTCTRRRTINPEIYQLALRIAQEVLNEGRRLAMIQNALYFHSTSVSPRWSRDKDIRRIAQIGAHIFYISVPTGT